MAQQATSALLQQIFEVTLEPVEGSPATYLKSLADELKADDVPLTLSVDNLDSVIWAIVSEKRLYPQAAFSYLFSSWKRLQNTSRDARRALAKPKLTQESKTTFEHQLDTVASIQPLIVNYALLAATEPEVISSTVQDAIEAKGEVAQSNAESTFNFGSYLLKYGDAPLFWDFFNLLVDQATTNETVQELISPILQVIHDEALKLGSQPLSANSIFSILEHLVANKTIASAITDLPTFSPASLTASTFERDSVLGPLFNISPLHGSRAASLFPPEILSNPGRRGRISAYGPGFDSPQVLNIYSSLRVELNIVNSHLFSICDKIVRSGEGPRTKLLNYFGRILDLNHKRTAMQVDPDTIASDAFMINITSVLIRFCEPFLSPTGPKIDKISLDYFRSTPSFSISDETAINADSDQANEYYKNPLDTKPNFISHVFYLTIGYLHYGPSSCAQSHERINRRLDDFKNHEDFLNRRLERVRGTFQETTTQRALNKLISEREQILAYQYLLGSYLFDKENQAKVIDFMLFLTVFFVRVVDPEHKHPHTQIKLPITSSITEQFGYFPEYFIEIIPSYFIFISKHAPYLIVHSGYNLSPLLTFLIVFLDKNLNIKNPYVKTKFVETLYFGAIELYVNTPGYFVNLFNSDKLSLDNLFHVLMQFYIEIERTGAASQFEDKFNARYHTAQIFKVIWKNGIYQQRLASESKQDTQFFVRFVALLLNDATYLMDESLSKLAEIHKLQVDIEKGEKRESGESTESVEGENQPDLGELQTQLSSVGRMARFYVQMAQESATLLRLFTEAVPQAFVTSELVDRLAAMLDYNLEALVGPKYNNLRVKNPEQYGFKSRDLLSAIVDVYLHLAKNDQNPKDNGEPHVFARAVARDGRSYKHELFVRAASIMTNKHLKDPGDVSRWLTFASKVQEMLVADQEEEDDLGDDIPDEFLDPLMYTIMKNPVTLPTSKIDVDLSTIKSHLLSEAHDPFNRTPLKLEDVIENVELKQRITEWKETKRREKQEKRLKDVESADGDVVMG